MPNRVRLILAMLATAVTLAVAASACAQPPPGIPPVEPDALPDELNLVDSLPAPEPDIVQSAVVGSVVEGEAGADDQPEFTLPPPVEVSPAAVRNSGAWVRDGITYFQADVVLLNRNFYRDVFLASDSSAASNRRLIVEMTEPGLAALGRFTIGQMMLRDPSNRDHSVEFTFYGLGEWTAEGSIESAVDDFLVSDIDPFIGGFNASDMQRFEYNTDFDNYELNYRIAWRPGRDRMVLQPDGTWVQQLSPATVFSVLAGIRVVQVDELFSYIARGTDPTTRRGDLSIRTNNDLVGFQIGGDYHRRHTVWSYGVRGKAGAYVNFASGSQSLVTVDNVFTEIDRQVRAEEDSLAFVGELGVFAKYHPTPRIAFRIAYEAMWHNTVALAPEQIDFRPGTTPRVNAAGSQWFQGMSLGFEFFW